MVAIEAAVATVVMLATATMMMVVVMLVVVVMLLLGEPVWGRASQQHLLPIQAVLVVPLVV